MTSSNSEKFIVVGKISTAFGIKGWVKVISFTQPVENLSSLRPWTIDGRKAAVEECKKHGDGLVAKLEGCDDRDAALLLSGKEISVQRAQLPELTDQEYYWSDLQGLRVVTVEGIELGTVSYLFETGSNDVMTIVNADNKERYVPFIIEEVVKRVDLTEKIIEVEWNYDF